MIKKIAISSLLVVSFGAGWFIGGNSKNAYEQQSVLHSSINEELYREYLGECYDEFVAYKEQYKTDKSANISKLCRLAMKDAIPEEMRPPNNSYYDQHLLIRVWETALNYN